MNKCPITYEWTEGLYSKKGLQLLSYRLKNLKLFALTSHEQVQKALEIVEKLSIQGVQPKLILHLNVSKEEFSVMEKGGEFILKPPHAQFEELPENEDLTMKMASEVGISVPIHGLIYNIDQTLSYFIKRFDRVNKKTKLRVEDFSQLSGHSRETKYESSMEKVALLIDQYCTFPLIEKAKLFRLVLFNFLVGNEDMHLKNFSLLEKNGVVELTPAYDLLNTTIVLKTSEEIALPLKGKKSRLSRKDFFEYYGKERLGLNETHLKNEETHLLNGIKTWEPLIEKSFLSPKKQQQYKDLYKARLERLLD